MKNSKKQTTPGSFRDKRGSQAPNETGNKIVNNFEKEVEAESVKIPELLAPVGSFETFMAALDAGADAVYLGLKKFSARARAENFSLADLELLTAYAHQHQVKVYVALNTLIRNDELEEIYRTLNALVRIKVDAVIVQDLGLVNIIRRDFPTLDIHLSTQLTIHNAAGANRLAGQGCKRVVLGRELSLVEIDQVGRSSAIELELFVYGALCVSVAGICQFSSFFGGQSANRGRCSQPCRRPYRYQGEEGYFFSPADFSALEFLPELVKSGIASCKIEGRMKGSQYVKVVISVFRRALDEIKSSGTLSSASLKKYREALKEAYARPATPANLSGRYPDAIIEPKRAATIGAVIGKIRRVNRVGGRQKGGPGGSWKIILRSTRQLDTGDRLKVVRQGKDGRDNSFTVKDGDCRIEKKGTGKGSANVISLILPFTCQAGDLLVKVGSRDCYGRKGSLRIRKEIEAAVGGARPQTSAVKIKPVVYRPSRWCSLPEGAAATATSDTEPQSVKPKWLIKLSDFNAARPFLKRRGFRVALELNGRIGATTAGRERELFRRFPKLEWSLPPLNYPGRETAVAEMVERLTAAGFRKFHLNGIGQLELFPVQDEARAKFKLATGPFLHAANQAAVSYYIEQGFSTVHLSSELDKATINDLKAWPGSSLSLTVFSFMPLLLTRVPLPLHKRGKTFLSSRREEIVACKRDGLTALVSDTPFSLLKQLNHLRNPDIGWWVIDLTWAPASFDLRRFYNPSRFNLEDLNVTPYNFTGEWR